MKRLNASLLILAMLFSMMWGQSAPDFGQIWHDYEQNPTYREYSVDSTWNEGSISFATWGHAMWDGEQYRLYVSRRGAQPTRTVAIGVFFKSHLDSAWVPYENNPIFEPDANNWDSSHVATPMVIKDGELFKMWYSAWNVSDDDWHFGYAESADGIDWTRQSSPVLSNDASSEWDSYWGLTPYVVKENETTYTMYYAGTQATSNSNWFIGCAHSTDGINWTREAENPIIGHEGPWGSDWVHIPVVKKIDENYVMWFSGATAGASHAQIGTAISSDGVHWRKDYLYNPIQSQGISGTWNEVGVYPLEVFEIEGEFKLYYGAVDDSWDYVGYGYSSYDPKIVPPGEVSGTWTKADSPIRVQGEIIVPDGETLTIEAGTTIEFLTHDPLLVQGQLLALGSETEAIRFLVDDTSGFHNDVGSDGVWGGIRFEGTAVTNDSSKLNACNLQFAKTFSGNGGGLALEGTGGGALSIINFSKVLVEDCLFQNNSAIGNFLGIHSFGGAINIQDHSDPVIKSNLIQNNRAIHLQSPGYSQGGGIMIYESCDPLILGNTIRNNLTYDTGGGIAIFTDCFPEITNNLIVGNIAADDSDPEMGAGGGVSLGWDSRPIFINNTIVNNIANWTGGGVYANEGEAIIINTIIANNEALLGGGIRGDQLGSAFMSGKHLYFQNSLLENGPANILWWNNSQGIIHFEQSISADPYLRPNYTLNPYFSPCFGAGISSCVVDGVTYAALPQDISGHACPDPPGSSPDMGAFESYRSGHEITTSWNWENNEVNPVFNPGPQGAWDDVRTWSQDVLFFDDLYHMWYAGDNGSSFQIGYATSTDGITWERYQDNPVLTGASSAWYGTHLYMPRVLRVGDILHMWFFNSANKVGHATSNDGIDWRITANPVLEGDAGTWDASECAVVDVIHDGSQFVMWYLGGNVSGRGVGVAYSDDGFTWDKAPENPVFVPNENGWTSNLFYASTVIYNGAQYIMWYSGNDGNVASQTGRASSEDGINWTDNSSSGPEIVAGELGSWNELASFFPAALIHQGQYKVWYNGAPEGADQDHWKIGYASMVRTTTDIKPPQKPQSFMLSQNYPNPFNPMTHIRYSLPENGDVSLIVYDVLGREVVELVNDHRSVGNYETIWYGLDGRGRQVSTGVYFARLQAGRQSDIIKMLFLK